MRYKNNVNIHDLAFYHRFISELEPSEYKEDDEKRLEIKEGIEQLIMKELKNIISKEKNKEKNAEKEKIFRNDSRNKINTTNTTIGGTNMSEIYEKIGDKEVYIISLKGAYLEVVENHNGVAIYRKIDIIKESV